MMMGLWEADEELRCNTEDAVSPALLGPKCGLNHGFLQE